MRAIIIRHGKVDFKWKNWSTSEQFDMDCRKYDKASVKPFSSVVSKVKLPLLFWNISGRLQWLFNNHRQQECRKDTIYRAEQLVKVLLHNEENCAIITHGFFMHILSDSLKKNGFCISNVRLQYSNGEYITAER